MAVSQSDTTEAGVGGGDLAATTLTAIYTMPSSARNAVKYAKELWICNRSAGAITVRVAIAPLGAADAVDHYIYYGKSIAANDSLQIAFHGLRLNPTDEVRVYSDSGDVTALLFVDSRV